MFKTWLRFQIFMVSLNLRTKKLLPAGGKSGASNNMSNIIIRRANQEDIEALAGLLKELFSIEKDFIFDENKQLCGLKMMMENDNSRCIMVAEINKIVVGMCTAQILISTAEGGKAALIEDVVVNENFKGQGIGQLLMSSIEDWSISQDAKRLALLADRNNKIALEFYEALKWNKTQLICLHKRACSE